MRSLTRLALGASLLLALMPVGGIASAASAKLYLAGDGYPVASMSETSPPGGALPNYDPSRGPGPGLTIKKGGDGPWETDPDRFQQWEYDASGATLSVSSFRIWVTEEGMNGDKDVEMAAYLMRCSSSCLVLDSATKSLKNQTGWKMITLPLAAPESTYGPGERLVVKIIVTENSEEDMWFAYGVSSHAARLQLATFTPPASTTTTTTLPPTTSTLPPTTTSTTRPGSTTTLPSPPTTPGRGHSTTTLPSAPTTQPDTPTTSIVPSDVTNSTTTTTVVVAGGDGSGGNGTESPTSDDLSETSAEILAASFGNEAALQPQEGLMVAFATVSETSRLYWQAAVALGALFSILLLVGVGRIDIEDDPDTAFLQRLRKMN